MCCCRIRLQPGWMASRRFTRRTRAEQTQTFVRLAEKQGLLVTGGSDFHGPIGDLEVSLGTIGLPADAIAQLDTRIELLTCCINLANIFNTEKRRNGGLDLVK